MSLLVDLWTFFVVMVCTFLLGGGFGVWASRMWK